VSILNKEKEKENSVFVNLLKITQANFNNQNYDKNITYFPSGVDLPNIKNIFLKA